MRKLLAALLLIASPALAEPLVYASMGFDELMLHASRYGSTELKRERKAAAEKELFSRGPEALEYLINRADIENVSFGVYIQLLIERLPPEESAPVLLSALDSKKKEVRKMAIFFLGFNSLPQYADRVFPFLQKEYEAGVAMRTLGKWGVREAVPGIIPYLRDSDERRRIVAANALHDIGDPLAIPALRAVKRDRYFTVRRAVERALKKLSAPRDVLTDDSK
ncbi:MAG: HEAT repeat domain-containing protein [Kiritimatiellia bacterium]